MMPIDITGQRFGKLVAVAFVRSVQQGKQKRQFWLFRCDCGNEREMQKGSVTSGAAISCGCHRQANFTEANEKRRAAAALGKMTCPLAGMQTSLATEQLANRSVVPLSMQKLPGRIVQARHSNG